MKFLFVSSVYAPNEIGGAERTVRTVAEALVQRGHQVVVVSLSADGREHVGEVGGVKTYYVRLRNVGWPFGGKARTGWQQFIWHLLDAYNPLMGRAFGKILDIERPDLIQTGNIQGFSVAVWRAAKRRNIPLVQMLHDYYLSCANSSMFRDGHNCVGQCGRCHVLGAGKRWLSGIPAAVIGLSDRTLEKVEGAGLFKEVPIKAIVRGASKVSCAAVSRPDRVAGLPITVGYIGRIERTKGVEVLLDIVKYLPAGAVRIVLAGKGDDAYVEQLKNAYASDDIEFLGFRSPGSFFESIDLLVVPSLWEEPLGRVIYEAYAFGVPVAVSRVGGMPEIVEAGVTGAIFEAGDSQGLAKWIGGEIANGWRGNFFASRCQAAALGFDINARFSEFAAVWNAVLGHEAIECK